MSGALQWQELMQIATGIGFAPPILVKSVVFESEDPQVAESLGKHCRYIISILLLILPVGVSEFQHRLDLMLQRSSSVLPPTD